MEKLNELVKLANFTDISPNGFDKGKMIAVMPETILAIAEAFRAMEQGKISAEHERDCHMDIADYFKERWLTQKQRAEAAEAKLAELEKQEPVAYSWRSFKKSQLTRTSPESWKQPRDIQPLFTRPAPAADLAELVPDEISPDDAVKILADRYGEFGIDHHLCCDSFEVGANWRRSQILRNIEEAK